MSFIKLFLTKKFFVSFKMYSAFLSSNADSPIINKGLLALFSFLAQCTVIGWIPATIHAFFVINSHKAEVQSQKTIKAINEQTNEFMSSINAHSEISARQAHAQIELSKAQIATQMETTSQLINTDAKQDYIPVRMIEEARFQVSRNNKVIGSWTKSEIRQFLSSGNLISSDWVWDTNKNSWIKADEFIA